MKRFPENGIDIYKMLYYNIRIYGGIIMTSNVTIWAAFVNGLISFFSPCVLPLLPLYLGYLAGEAIDQNKTQSSKLQVKLLVNAFGFVLGLSFYNILLGFGAKALTGFFIVYKEPIRILGGVIMMLFGLYFISNKTLDFMESERRLSMKHYTPKFLQSILLGITFSFGWTPCNGPIIASIMIMAGFQKDYLSAGGLMLVYSLGFSVMFLLSALLAATAIQKFRKLNPYLPLVKRIGGFLMLVMGFLLAMDWISVINKIVQ